MLARSSMTRPFRMTSGSSPLFSTPMRAVPQPARSPAAAHQHSAYTTTSGSTTTTTTTTTTSTTAAGVAPALPNKTIRSILATTPEGGQVKVQGWIRSTRQQKQIAFAEVNDGSSLKGLQAILNSDQARGLVAGTSVEMEGKLVKSLGKEQALELQVETLKVVGKCDGETYPLQKKRHTFEFLRGIAHLRSRAKTASAILRLRSQAHWGFQKFFESQEFTQVHTPCLTSHDCEGGGEVFQIAPRISARDQKKASSSSSSSTSPTAADLTPKEFFGSPAYLTVSGQLHLEIIASALTRVFTLGPVFRAEPSMTPRHLSEFWMLEAEVAFVDHLDQLLTFAEACLQSTTRHILENCREDIAFLNQWVDKTLLQRLEQMAYKPFQRMTYTEAIDVLSKSGQKFEFPTTWGVSLQSEHEKWLAAEYCKGPVFVTDYPAGLKPFYMRKNADGKTVGCVDLLVPGIGELMGGSLREERLDVLQQQLKQHGLSEQEYDWYLDLRRFGTVPHAGWGVGFERYMLLITGMDNVRDVSPFPRYNNHCRF
ncbi:hypothetical protein BGZ73_003163 [Actinomortierella ambigua]|nr:hypothetical protein BGZ73_003163 [Actinomortierella ambigua]